MNKTLITSLLTLGLTCNAHAKTFPVDYSGDALTQNVILSNGDVVMINTKVDEGTKVKIRFSPNGIINSALFTFNSNLPGASGKRFGNFTDTFYPKTNPDAVSYTYTGNRDKMKAFVDVGPN